MLVDLMPDLFPSHDLRGVVVEVALVTPTQTHLLQVFMLMMDRQVVVVVEADHMVPHLQFHMVLLVQQIRHQVNQHLSHLAL